MGVSHAERLRKPVGTVAGPATADAAATLIANAVDIDHPSIVPSARFGCDPDSDLGDRLVTVEVGEVALAAGGWPPRAGGVSGTRFDCGCRAHAAG